MVTMEQSEYPQDVLPVVAFDFGAGVAAEQRELKRPRVVGIDRNIQQVFSSPPAHHRRAEWIWARRQECDETDDRDEDLREAAAEKHRQLAERREHDVAGLMERDADNMQE